LDAGRSFLAFGFLLFRHDALTHTMASDKETAQAYMKKHNLLGLFDELSTKLIYSRPADPKKFLIEELQKRRQHANTSFFTETDFRAMFNMFDKTGKGVISPAQMEQAVMTLGSRKNFKMSSRSKVNEEAFVKTMTAAQKAINAKRPK
jgi:Ca2+-binding EF-hand superfamily protein